MGSVHALPIHIGAVGALHIHQVPAITLAYHFGVTLGHIVLGQREIIGRNSAYHNLGFVDLDLSLLTTFFPYHYAQHVFSFRVNRTYWARTYKFSMLAIFNKGDSPTTQVCSAFSPSRKVASLRPFCRVQNKISLCTM